MYSWSAGKIVKYLKEHHPAIEVCACSGGGFQRWELYSHGLRATLTPELDISIQTAPIVAGDTFAETALINTRESRLVNIPELGYGEGVMRHGEPEDLWHHLEEIIDKLNKNPNINESRPVQVSNE